jgi:hypothetical protein
MMNDMEIDTVILEDETEIKADAFIADCDPVILFKNYFRDVSVSPAFKNRIIPNKNEKDCLSLTVTLNQPMETGLIAPSVKYIGQALNDMRAEGGSQYPLLSILKQDEKTYNILAQYYEFGLEVDNEESIKMAVTQAIVKHHDPEFESKIEKIKIDPCATQFGMPSFSSAMPLLQLYKVFSGYHSIAYDTPIANMTFAGYGKACAGHHHMRDGGERVANLYQNLFETGT